MGAPVDWDRLRRAKEDEVESLRALRLSEITPSRRDFSQFLGIGRGEVGVIATLRRRDPCSGETWDDLDVAAAAAVLDDADVAALAITTEPLFHAGRVEDLAVAAQAATAPLLRDEPLLHPLQVYQSRMLGADACVLTVGWMAAETLAEAVRVARSLHMTPLLAVASESEVDVVLAQDHAHVVGLLALDASGRVDLARARRLAALIPARRPVLLLGDVVDAAQWAELRGTVDAALVAHALMGGGDLAERLEAFVG